MSLETPLLIPSFSSKGFAISKKKRKSEIGEILAAVGQILTESFLISAYDVHYGHLPKPQDLSFKPEIVFLDSGGYEISTDRDYSSVIDAGPMPEKWELPLWQSVVSSWPSDLPMVAISYDHHDERHDYLTQVKSARKQFKSCPDHLHSFLLKPETTTQTLLTEALKAVNADPAELSGFDMVGVTEKELGKSALDRMVNIARLRQAMDEGGVKVPIHVFGALDPISVVLYFLAGAEIFDGLTWIRYAYNEGQCVYSHNHGVLKYGIDADENQIKARAMTDNYYYLQNLQRQMRDFETTKNWEKLAPHSQMFKDAFDSLTTRLKRR